MSPYSFPATISARDIQRGYKKVFDTVKRTKKPVVVMANNNPQAAIISVGMLEDYVRAQENQKVWDAIDAIRFKNRNKSFKKVYKDITKITEEVRQEMYDKAHGNR